jgi:hypothetical protein
MEFRDVGLGGERTVTDQDLGGAVLIGRLRLLGSASSPLAGFRGSLANGDRDWRDTKAQHATLIQPRNRLRFDCCGSLPSVRAH